MKQNICELDTMIFFREALEAHEFMLLPVMASAVVECRTADKELKTLNEDGEIGLARLFSIWANHDVCSWCSNHCRVQTYHNPL